jgi:hypothetical protein
VRADDSLEDEDVEFCVDADDGVVLIFIWIENGVLFWMLETIS